MRRNDIEDEQQSAILRHRSACAVDVVERAFEHQARKLRRRTRAPIGDPCPVVRRKRRAK